MTNVARNFEWRSRESFERVIEERFYMGMKSIVSEGQKSGIIGGISSPVCGQSGSKYMH
jgi:hypothetical protein